MRTAGLGRARLTQAAGWLATGVGTVHLVVTLWQTRTTWSQARSEGWWNTFTLNEPTTMAEAKRTVVFWETLGSFGAPLLALGSHVLWSTHRQRRVPRWLGGIVLAWGVPFVITLPRSPGWTFPVIGALIVAGDKEAHPPLRRSSGSAASAPAAWRDWSLTRSLQPKATHRKPSNLGS
jgi:Family of unknown function (DUF6463)